MTIELAVALPVLIVVAVMAVNALQFFGKCAEFDRAAHDAVRIYAAAPQAGADDGQACAAIRESLHSSLGIGDGEDVSIQHSAAGFGFDEYVATLEYCPTLFGMGLRSSVMGVPMPRLSHSTRFVVDVYHPGVVT